MSDNNKINISLIAYLKSLMYFQRFTNDSIDKKDYKFAYGLLKGFIDVDNELYIEDFIPIKNFNDQYVIFEEQDIIFKHLQEIDEEYSKDEYPEYILGWARNSVHNDLEPSLIDKKNQILFQNTNPRSFFWIFDNESLAIGDGIKLFAFKDDFKTINMTSELTELSYTFSKDAYFDEIVQLAIEIEEKRKSKEILIRGIEE